jgi:hypothetical protein
MSSRELLAPGFFSCDDSLSCCDNILLPKNSFFDARQSRIVRCDLRSLQGIAIAPGESKSPGWLGPPLQVDRLAVFGVGTIERVEDERGAIGPQLGSDKTAGLGLVEEPSHGRDVHQMQIVVAA